MNYLEEDFIGVNMKITRRIIIIFIVGFVIMLSVLTMPQKVESKVSVVTLQTGEIGRYRFCYSINSFGHYDVIIDTTTGKYI